MPFPNACHRIPLCAVLAALAVLAATGSGRPSLAAATDRKPAKAAEAKPARTKHAPAPRASSAEIAAAFQVFCEDWMRTLAGREQKSLAEIKWDTIADGVQGTYTGYTKEHTCTVKEKGLSDPVGKITYLEVRYEKRGAAVGEAQQSQPRPVESTEVVELFRYAKGKWIY